MTTIRSTSKADNSNQDVETNQNSIQLYDMPKYLKEVIYLNYLSTKEFCFFAQTCHQAEADTAFSRLMMTAVYAAPESYKQDDKTKLAAIAMLKRHPELLFRKGEVIDHFGRMIMGSTYQLFLGAGDVWALNQIHEEIIKKIEDKEAREQIEAQTKAEFQAQFPDYSGPWPLDPNMPEEALYDKRNKEQIEQVKAKLKDTVEKITNDPCTNGQATLDETIKAVADLCQIFEPKEVIKTGLHFPLAIMRKIYQAYIDYTCDIKLYMWNPDQAAYFVRTVIGAAEAALTTVDGQCCKNGLKDLVDKQKYPDRRDGLFCRHPKGIPQALTPITDKLGHTMFVDPYNGYSCATSYVEGNIKFHWYNKNGDGLRWWLQGGESLLKIHQLMKNKSRDMCELLCGNAQRSQYIVSTIDNHQSMSGVKCVIL